METEENVRFVVEKDDYSVVISTESSGSPTDIAVSATVEHSDIKESPKWDRTALIRQLSAASGAVIGSISFGMTTAFGATLLPQLAKHAAFSMDTNCESWIASSVVLSMFAGVTAGGVISRFFGRRRAQMCLYVWWTCGWIALWRSFDVWCLLAGCVLVGLGAGSHSVASAVYIGEISEPRFRGVISIQISLGVAVGILTSHVLGVVLDWRVACAISAALPAIAFVLVVAFAIESPTWLMLRERVETAKKHFLTMRNEASGCEDELNSLAKAVAEYRVYDIGESGTLKGAFSCKAFLRSFFVLNVLFVVQQGSGLNAVVFYAIRFLTAMLSVRGINDVSSPLIVIDTVRLFATLASCVLIKVVSRRKLYFCSASGTIASISGLVLCNVYGVSNFVTVVFLCAYIASLYVGLSPIPWIMIGELYPANLKELGICISGSVCFLTLFVVVKTALFFDLTTILLVYETVTLIGVIFLYFYMPETNDISLQQIENNMKA